MTLHYGDVERVAGRQAFGTVHDFLGALDIRCLYRKNLVNDSRQRIEGRGGERGPAATPAVAELGEDSERTADQRCRASIAWKAGWLRMGSHV